MTTTFPPFRTPTLDYEFQLVRAHTQVILPESDTSDNSDYWRTGRLVAAVAWQLYGPIQYTGQQLFPETADEEHLKKWGRQLDIPRKTAAKSTGLALLLGTLGSTQASSSTAQSASGTIVKTTGIGAIALAPWVGTKKVAWFNFAEPDYFIVDDVTGISVGDVFTLGGKVFAVKDLPGGNAVFVYGRIPGDPRKLVITPKEGAVVPIIAADTGLSGNLTYNTPIGLDLPGLGIDATMTVLELNGGDDTESLDGWRRRMRTVRTEYPAGGNRSQLVKWMEDIAGVDRAWLYSRYRGRGTSDGVPQGVRRARHLSALRRTDVQTKLYPTVPSTVNPGLVAPGIDFQATDFSELPVEFNVLLEPQPGYEPDWTGFFTIGAAPAINRIPTTTSPIGKIAAGHRVAVRIGPFFDLVVAAVESVDGGGVNLNPALDDVPAAGDFLMPGGPLTDPAAVAIDDLVDSLGPGDTIPPSRFPPPSAEFPGRLPLSRLIAVLQGIPGVAKVVIVSPASDVIPIGKTVVTIIKITIGFIP